MNAKIKVRDFSLTYGEKPILRRINLDVPAGEITALIGPSGAGKSSFLRALNRTNDWEGVREDGTVLLDDLDIYGPGTDVVQLRKRVGMVFQTPIPFPMSIFDNVAFGPRIHGLRRRGELMEIVERSLKQTALWDELQDRLEQSALSLSVGQRQRLCIARVLAVKSEVLLLDEPCADLDAASTMKIEDLLHQLKANYTIILATNLQQAGRIADRTAFFWEGELVEEGPTKSLFQKPGDPRTEAYLTGRFG
jgi:phosphate transport system ATP-binding protein